VLHRQARGDADGAALSAVLRRHHRGGGSRWVAVTLNEIAPKDAKGLPVTRSALSESDKKTVIEGLLSACDGLDDLRTAWVSSSGAIQNRP